jgi:hypothetical protein
VVSTHGDEL